MIIYKLQNILNNKIYIGKTKISSMERFNQHVKASLNNTSNTVLSKAIRKYGKESFTTETVEDNLNHENINE